MKTEQISADGFRELFGVVPAAVAVVTTQDEGGPHGTTVSAFGALSLDPPLVQVSLDLGSKLLARVRGSGRFLINVLADDQQDLARRFARQGPDDFDGVEWVAVDGLPMLTRAHGWLAASVERTVEAGDHAIVIGLARDAGINEGVPLLYRDRTFRVLSPLDDDLPADPAASRKLRSKGA
jgi:flavin reductase (DIM6/NTAB) family NADH-FMN oxidoreductase RutF